RVAQWLSERRLADAKLAALAPGAAHATNRWPVAPWSALIEQLRAAGFRPMVVGGPEDRGLAQQLVAGGAAASAAGEFSLQETGALLARAAVAVSGDTGVMHMATGVGTPVIALFGPTVEQFGFFPYRAPGAVLQRELPCRPCPATGTATCPPGPARAAQTGTHGGAPPPRGRHARGGGAGAVPAGRAGPGSARPRGGRRRRGCRPRSSHTSITARRVDG